MGEHELGPLWGEGPDGLAVVDDDGVISAANPRLAGWLGQSEAELRGRRLTELGLAASAGDEDFVLGSDRWLSPYRVPMGDRRRLLGLRDVTARIRAERVRDLHRAALEDSLNAYDVVDDQGRLVHANRAYLSMWGYDDVDEIIGMSAAEHCADPDVPRQIIEAVHAGGRTTFEFEGRRKDGSTFPVLMSVQATENERGEPRYFGTSLDITELQLLREARERAGKLAAVGQLAAGVAHDFNNLLMPILGYADLLAQDARTEEDRELLEAICGAARRARQLTQQLLTLTRKPSVRPRQAELGAAVQELEGLLRRALRENISLTIARSDEPVWVMVDDDRLQQVLLNLVNNAQDAMPGGGRLTLGIGHRTFDDTDDERMLRGLKPGTYGELVVTDDGEGMTPETLARVFEPFFSTKGDKGTGLGLANVRTIVEEHGGAAWVYSEVGRGTTLRIYLPRVAPGDRTHDVAPPIALASCDVLLVEDEPMVRAAMTAMLTRAGHRVHAFEGGAAALRWLDHGGTADVLVSDVVLAEQENGPSLATTIAARAPGIRVLFVSGYAGTDSATPVPHLQKPFSSRELLERLAEVLNAPG